LKPSSVQTYDKAVRHFGEVFGGEVPCDRQTVERYVASMRKGSPSTAYLRVLALRHAHVQAGVPSPTDEPGMRAMLRSLQLGIFPGKTRGARKRREPRQARRARASILRFLHMFLHDESEDGGSPRTSPDMKKALTH
jgi:hypothetical protein